MLLEDKFFVAGQKPSLVHGIKKTKKFESLS